MLADRGRRPGRRGCGAHRLPMASAVAGGRRARPPRPQPRAPWPRPGPRPGGATAPVGVRDWPAGAACPGKGAESATPVGSLGHLARHHPGAFQLGRRAQGQSQAPFRGRRSADRRATCPLLPMSTRHTGHGPTCPGERHAAVEAAASTGTVMTNRWYIDAGAARERDDRHLGVTRLEPADDVRRRTTSARTRARAGPPPSCRTAAPRQRRHRSALGGAQKRRCSRSVTACSGAASGS